MPRAPAPHHINYQKFLTILGVFLLFSIFIYLGSVSYTGFAIREAEIPFSENQNILLNSQFEVLEIEKSPNSVLNLDVESELTINFFVEIEDCDYWLNGKDNDNEVLYAINSIKKGNMKIGDPSTKTVQQVDLYRTEELCLILINREYPNSGNVNLKYNEIEKDLWKII